MGSNTFLFVFLKKKKVDIDEKSLKSIGYSNL